MTIHKKIRTTFLLSALSGQWFPDKELLKTAPFHCAMSIRYYSFGTHVLIKSFLMVFFSCAYHQRLWRSHVPNNKRRTTLSSHFTYGELRRNKFSAFEIVVTQFLFYFIHRFKSQLMLISAPAVTLQKFCKIRANCYKLGLWEKEEHTVSDYSVKPV